MITNIITANRILKFIMIAVCLVLILPVFFSEDTAIEHGQTGFDLSVWSILPFIGMLLSIALIPLFRQKWWEKNLLGISVFWSLCVIIYLSVFFGASIAGICFYEMLILDYLPFIVLLWGLYVVSGGIVIRGSLQGTPRSNLVILFIGTILASWIGTTGASVLLIRPILRSNKWRGKKVHIIVFFIFLVSNMGGCLTPIGDPPLFLGFLRNVPFFWTMNLLPLLLFNSAILFLIFYILDKRLYKKDIEAGRKPETDSIENGHKKNGKIRIEGKHNLIFLIMIVCSVILSGQMGKMHILTDHSTGEIYGIPFIYGISIPINSLTEILIILLVGFLSFKTTGNTLRKLNSFTWGPIKEVACLFIGIFVSMIPVLLLLQSRGPELGLTEPWQYFWATGILSSFLDNAPTYLVFMTAAASLPAGAAVGSSVIATSVGSITSQLLMAVTAGAVFMGANTYIGNAPNFMVRSIAEEDGVNMPSFFGYMTWSGRYLIPLFIINTFLLYVL